METLGEATHLVPLWASDVTDVGGKEGNRPASYWKQKEKTEHSSFLESHSEMLHK